ncbi:ATP-grasp fold amidoligase family protein [Halopseudomonas xiamenensis]|uniref:ATP-grasp fold amidoligase family protein n=1 Tax=Halopseudomonas xiamenensis TaxID=157792 RepID=UPI0016244699|nr:ATP-grasp fold amidoligase family protein [Halopseudomonas xiamenensis]
MGYIDKLAKLKEILYRYRYSRARKRILQEEVSDYKSFFKRELDRRFEYTRIKGRALLGYDVNLDNPKTFNEKLIHRRLFSRDSVWPIVTDKILARTWVAPMANEAQLKLIPAVSFYDIDSFDFSGLELPVVVKANWASGLNIFIRDLADISIIKERLKIWRDSPYKMESLIWAAHEIKRGFLVEKMLVEEDGKVPADYKFFVFHGKVSMIQVDLDRFSGHTRGAFSRSGDRLPYNFSAYKAAPEEASIPKATLDKLIPVAEKIGAKFDFARVDLYLHGGDVFFGEITQTPSAGFGRFSDKCFDEYLGGLWQYTASTEVKNV